jgi:hypothetical protein
MMYLASYRCPPHRPQPGQLLDWLLRWAFHVLVCVGTLSRYSHSELVFGEPDHRGESLCATSSGRDGGVRFKRIKLDPARWTVDPLTSLHPYTEARAYSWFVDHKGEPYDHQGLAAVWLFTVAPFMRVVWRLIQARRRWFCSESAAAALGLWRPWTRSPGALRRWAVKQLPKA